MRPQAISGIGAGLTAALCTNPLDVGRARLQVLNHHGDGATIRSTSGALWRREGVRGFFRGVTARMGKCISGARARRSCNIMNTWLSDYISSCT